MQNDLIPYIHLVFIYEVHKCYNCFLKVFKIYEFVDNFKDASAIRFGKRRMQRSSFHLYKMKIYTAFLCIGLKFVLSDVLDPLAKIELGEPKYKLQLYTSIHNLYYKQTELGN